MDSLRAEILLSELEALKADNERLSSLNKLIRDELDGLILMNERYKSVILSLQEQNSVWMARALKAESMNRGRR